MSVDTMVYLALLVGVVVGAVCFGDRGHCGCTGCREAPPAPPVEVGEGAP